MYRHIQERTRSYCNMVHHNVNGINMRARSHAHTHIFVVMYRHIQEKTHSYHNAVHLNVNVINTRMRPHASEAGAASDSDMIIPH